VRKLAMVEPFLNMADLTGQGRWLAVKQLESICEHEPTLIMEAMEYATLKRVLAEELYDSRVTGLAALITKMVVLAEDKTLRAVLFDDLLKILHELAADPHISFPTIRAILGQLRVLMGAMDEPSQRVAWEAFTVLFKDLLQTLYHEHLARPVMNSVVEVVHGMAQLLAQLPQVDWSPDLWSGFLDDYHRLVAEILRKQGHDPYPAGDNASCEIQRMLNAAWAYQHSIYSLLKNEAVGIQQRREWLESFCDFIDNPFEAVVNYPQTRWHRLWHEHLHDAERRAGPFTQTLMDYSLAIAITQHDLPTVLRERLLRHVLDICMSYREPRFPNIYRLLLGKTRRSDMPADYYRHPLMKRLCSYRGLFDESIQPELLAEFRETFVRGDFGPKDDLYALGMVGLYEHPSSSEADRKAITRRLKDLSPWYNQFIPRRRSQYRCYRDALADIKLLDTGLH
ncbi:MAG: hypothetical protein KDK78_12200, partial [Chlamydiia bacterium]|nr:hypothetical protein [Chlamydiia bacterium]